MDKEEKIYVDASQPDHRDRGEARSRRAVELC
jgi:hypothetical protein